MDSDYSRFIKIPFVDGGRDYSGADCWGLVQLVMRDIYDTIIPDYRISCMDFIRINRRIRSEQTMPQWNRIEHTIEPCIILFSLNKHRRFLNHAGLYIGNGRFIHTIRHHGATINRIDHQFYRTRIEGYYQYAG